MSGYTIAKYLRISAEDADLKDTGKLESNSIANQRNLLDSYIARIPEFFGAAVVEFYDDGWSGKNFERPAFQKMIAAIKQGQIQCVIVKDDCVIIELNAESPIKCGFCAVSSIFWPKQAKKKRRAAQGGKTPTNITGKTS